MVVRWGYGGEGGEGVDAYGGAAGGLMLLYSRNLATFIHVLHLAVSHSAWFYFRYCLSCAYEVRLHLWTAVVSVV